MVYSVSMEGVEALRTMAAGIITAAEELLDNAEKLKAAGDGNNLGPHSASIVQAGESIFQAVVQAAQPIQDIADTLNDVAEGYEEVIGNDRIAGASGGREYGGYETGREKETTTGPEKSGERAPSSPAPGADSWARAFPDAGNSSGWNNMEPVHISQDDVDFAVNGGVDKETLIALRDKIASGKVVVDPLEGGSDDSWPEPPQKVLTRRR